MTGSARNLDGFLEGVSNADLQTTIATLEVLVSAIGADLAAPGALVGDEREARAQLGSSAARVLRVLHPEAARHRRGIAQRKGGL